MYTHEQFSTALLHNMPRFTKSWHVSYSCWKNNRHNVGDGQLYITTTLCGGQFRTRTFFKREMPKIWETWNKRNVRVFNSADKQCLFTNPYPCPHGHGETSTFLSKIKSKASRHTSVQVCENSRCQSYWNYKILSSWM